MSNQCATLRLFHSEDPAEDERVPSVGRHEEIASSGLAHPVRAQKHVARDERVSGDWAVSPRDEELAEPRSIEEIRSMAHALARALAARSEGVDASQWRVRVAAAQALALEDILEGVDR